MPDQQQRRSKDWVWHVCAWMLGAASLWADVRVFAVYAFATVLIVSRQVDDARLQVDHLRALVRVLSISHDAKLITIYEHLGLTHNDVAESCTRELLTLTPEQAQSLRDDRAKVYSPAPESR